MKVFYSDRVLSHAPRQELHNGAFAPAAEVSDRARHILEHVSNVVEPADLGWDPILNTHDADYIGFLQRAHKDTGKRRLP